MRLRADKLLRALGLLGLFTLWLAISALVNKTVRPHFLSLLYRSFLSFTNFKQTTPWAFISFDLVQPVLLLVFFAILLRRSHGEEAVKMHWRREGVIGLKAILLLAIFYYLPMLLWNGVRIVYNDHQSSVSANRRLAVENEDLKNKLSDTTTNAEQRCEQAKEGEITRLRKQLNAVCFNPSRRLQPMEKEQLFTALKRIRVEMEKQERIPYFRLDGFSGDAETTRFASMLWPIFQSAGWKWRPVPAQTPAEVKKAKDVQEEQEKWLRDQGLTEGIMVFDKNWPKGFGTAVEMAFSQLDLVDDWTQANRQQTSQLPHLNDLTVWIGYQPAR